jgi:hypothetical protein
MEDEFHAIKPVANSVPADRFQARRKDFGFRTT